jgi:hypothetical protein
MLQEIYSLCRLKNTTSSSMNNQKQIEDIDEF